ncbi:hypothetical protein GFL80_25730 [Rhizobium leguminosarum bv. viciae]|uniref:hypothetical protein n=1 Tax=Rhizobium leguminosarum TaxID=384 RepID=UPI001441297E|nr:hypothetical protein [Rhizobium leguminosarum]NKK87562.1 hypothetical protein [Rhizobium leguminosarum bv. viciae]
MQRDDTQNPTGKASGALSRRFLLRSAAATAALAVPVVAAADEETPLQKLCRLAHEASQALDDYEDGNFNAVIYPRSAVNGPINLVERSATLDEEITRCVSTLRGLLSRMHPEATVTTYRCIREDDQDRSIIFNVRYPRESDGNPHTDLNS